MMPVPVRPEPELLPTRKTLLSRLRNLDNQDSWKEFFDRYWRLIYNAALRSGLTDQEAQEVVQETIIAVSRNVGEFRYDPEVGSFKTWLLNLTHWRVVDQFRKRPRSYYSGPARPGTGLLESVPDPASLNLESVWDEEWERNVFDQAIARAKAVVDPKHYQVFDLYAFQELPAAEVARVMDIPVAQVYLIKHRVARLIGKQVKILQRQASARSL